MSKTNEKALQKNLGLVDAMMLVVGMVIGSGIFFKPAIVFKSAGTPLFGILAWVVGGIITIASGLTIAEIAAAIPKTGGVFVYLKELYGEKVAFLFGWVQTVVYIPGSIAALSILLAIQTTAFIPLTNMQQTILAIAFPVFITIINIISTKLGSKLQGLFTVAKFLPIIIIVFMGFTKGAYQGITFDMSGSTGIAGFGAAMLGTLWAYDGWVSVGNVAGELRNPKKDLPKSIILGLSLTIITYVLINIALIKILPFNQIIASDKPAADAAVILFGDGGAKIVSVGILISIFGALNGYMMTGVRVPFAMAQDKMIPFHSFIGKLTKKSSTPANAFIFEIGLAILYIFSGSFDKLTDLVMFILWVFFTLAVAGVFILRKKHPHIERPYSVPLYPITPLIGIVGSLYIIISTLITKTSYAMCGTVIALVGIPVYYYLNKKRGQD